MKPLSPRFLAKWLKAPRQIGAITPSSPELARAMAHHIPKSHVSYVIELGGGTGPVTKAILESGVAPERLIVIERDAELFRLLEGTYPKVKVIEGDALDLPLLLKKTGIEEVSAIVSSLPLLSMTKNQRFRLGAACLSVLKPGAPLIQFTYGPTSPIRKKELQLLGASGQKEGRVLRNIPPATIWVYRKI